MHIIKVVMKVIGPEEQKHLKNLHNGDDVLGYPHLIGLMKPFSYPKIPPVDPPK